MFLLIVLILMLVAFYFYSSYSYNYWAKRNIKHDATIPIFGNHFKQFLGLRNNVQTSSELYYKYPNELVVGYYRGPTPELIIRDPDIMRHILSVDFVHFYQRGVSRDTQKEPLLRNIFHSDDDVWKLVRQLLTPAFTISKLKAMFPLIIKCTEKIEALGSDIVAKGGECDARDFMGRFSVDSFCACGFGIETDAIDNDNSFFKNVGRRIFKRSLRQILLLGIRDLFPKLRNMVGVIDDNLKAALCDMIIRIFKQRNFKMSGRNDFIDLLFEISKKEKIVGESVEHTHLDGTPKQVELKIDEQLLIAQAFIFFAASYESTALATSCTLQKLSYYPDIQQKIQEEIDEVLLKHNGKLCYNSVAELTLLDKALNESMRMYPPAGFLTRVCTKEYKVPKLGVTIDPGVRILIPLQAIHNDKLYYDNPEAFNPDRFSPEEIKKRHKYVFLPYGVGPRACIGALLGHMQALAGLAAILRTFSVEPTKKSQRKLIADPRQELVQTVLNGIPIKLKLRKK